jgi:serine/threonine-protein kinase
MAELLRNGDTLGRYCVEQKLATGGMAQVYRAYQRGPSGFTKPVVLKVILPHLAEDERFVRLFHDEARLAALLNHSGIAQIFDLGSEDELHYIVMEHVHGVNLSDLHQAALRLERRVPAPMALTIVREVCRALHYAHQLAGSDGEPLGIVHRDVSLDNVMLSYSGEVKLLDFGIAGAGFLTGTPGDGGLEGKLDYSAPEVLRGGKPDHRVDIYAVGVVLYQLLLGRAPFVARTEAELLHRIVKEPPTPPRRIDPDLPDELERILLRALHKDPDARPQSAGEMASIIDDYLLSGAKAASERELAAFVGELTPQQSPGPLTALPTDPERSPPFLPAGELEAPVSERADGPIAVVPSGVATEPLKPEAGTEPCLGRDETEPFLGRDDTDPYLGKSSGRELPADYPLLEPEPDRAQQVTELARRPGRVSWPWVVAGIVLALAAVAATWLFLTLS